MSITETKVVIGGQELFIGTGLVAKQAHGAAMVRHGDNVVLVTATHSKKETERDYFPLSVDFEEKMYAAGKFPGGFLKRESRASDGAIISARLLDRSIRPLFPEDYKFEVQVICTTLSSDMTNPLDLLGLIGASVALGISDIPFAGPVSCVRICRIDGEFLVNPTFEQIAEGDLDLVVAGTDDAIMMVEGEADEIAEEDFLAALELAHKEIRIINEGQRDIIAKCGREKMTYEVKPKDEALRSAVREFASDRVLDALGGKMKEEREEVMTAVVQESIEKFATVEGEKDASKLGEVFAVIEELEKKSMRKMIWEQNIRADGRKLDEVRPISCAVGILPRPHGSALFTRGQTQVLSILTLSSLGDAQRLDTVSLSGERRYIHQYNFPPYSVGEVRPMRGPSRRDIGHGNLAERALIRMIPSGTEFAYALRIVSEVLESNGSSSMASVCGSSLSLMDGGVKIRKPVSGIAMGLIMHENGSDYKILTDIQGLEDHDGDMDFKVAGTCDGITAVQMDIKVKGITTQIMREAMKQAKEARLFILGKMNEAISEPRAELSPYAPRLVSLKIDIEKIGAVIGPGGKMIRKIVELTGAKIDIEDDGTVNIYSRDNDASAAAKKMVEDLTQEAEAGRIYDGTVKRVVSFGAFVEIFPGTEGLVHISQLSTGRVEKVEDVVNLGDKVKVRVREIDDMGRVNLTMNLDDTSDPAPRPPRRDNDRNGSRGGGDRGGNRGGGDRGPRRS